jgi:hypothetical protein
MCGLSGIVVTKPELIDVGLVKVIFSLLMQENDSRGGHSWGAWGNGIEPVKALGRYSSDRKPLHDRLDDYKFNTTPDSSGVIQPSFLFGHTRFGTHGDKTVDNAHPFTYGNITLAHNGVVDVYGYSATDHSVDSGRIAMAIGDDGWKNGMARVMGSCALLVSASDIPMIYRHNQVLHYATFPWGTVISSTKWDLELVVSKIAGLKPVEIGEVAEDVFCQPGWGSVWDPCPAQKAKSYSADAWRGGTTNSHWWDQGNEGAGTPVGKTWKWNQAKLTMEWMDDDSVKTTKIETLGWSGKSNLEKINKKNFPERGAKTRLTKRQRRQLAKQQPPIQGIIEHAMDQCQNCGYQTAIADLRRCAVTWHHMDVLLCIDCVMDEVADECKINVIGDYGSMMDAEIGESEGMSEADRSEIAEYVRSMGGVCDV